MDGLTLGQGGISIEREETFTEAPGLARRGLTTSRENLNNISRVSASPEKQLVYREGQEGRTPDPGPRSGPVPRTDPDSPTGPTGPESGAGGV